MEPVEKVCRLSTSNQSVSLHYHVFSYAPKSTIWSQNFTDLCHSAVHSSTFGTGRSSLAIASGIGIKYKATYLMYKQMLKIDANTDCHSQRKRSKQYKLSRHLSRKKKCWLKNCKQIHCMKMYQKKSQMNMHMVPTSTNNFNTSRCISCSHNVLYIHHYSHIFFFLLLIATVSRDKWDTAMQSLVWQICETCMPFMVGKLFSR